MKNQNETDLCVFCSIHFSPSTLTNSLTEELTRPQEDISFARRWGVGLQGWQEIHVQGAHFQDVSHAQYLLLVDTWLPDGRFLYGTFKNKRRRC